MDLVSFAKQNCIAMSQHLKERSTEWLQRSGFFQTGRLSTRLGDGYLAGEHEFMFTSCCRAPVCASDATRLRRTRCRSVRASDTPEKTTSSPFGTARVSTASKQNATRFCQFPLNKGMMSHTIMAMYMVRVKLY